MRGHYEIQTPKAGEDSKTGEVKERRESHVYWKLLKGRSISSTPITEGKKLKFKNNTLEKQGEGSP